MSSRRSKQLCHYVLPWVKTENGMWVQNLKLTTIQCEHSRAQHKSKQYIEKAIPRKGLSVIVRKEEYCTACTKRNKHHAFVAETGNSKYSYVLKGLAQGEVTKPFKFRNKPSKQELQQWETAVKEHEEYILWKTKK